MSPISDSSQHAIIIVIIIFWRSFSASMDLHNSRFSVYGGIRRPNQTRISPPRHQSIINPLNTIYLRSLLNDVALTRGRLDMLNC